MKYHKHAEQNRTVEVDHCGCSDLEYCDDHNPVERLMEKQETQQNEFRDDIVGFCMVVVIFLAAIIIYFYSPLNKIPDVIYHQKVIN